jgi:hypothetical protein
MIEMQVAGYVERCCDAVLSILNPVEGWGNAACKLMREPEKSSFRP